MVDVSLNGSGLVCQPQKCAGNTGSSFGRNSLLAASKAWPFSAVIESQ